MLASSSYCFFGVQLHWRVYGLKTRHKNIFVRRLASSGRPSRNLRTTNTSATDGNTSISEKKSHLSQIRFGARIRWMLGDLRKNAKETFDVYGYDEVQTCHMTRQNSGRSFRNFRSAVLLWNHGLSPPRNPSYKADTGYKTSVAPIARWCCLRLATLTASAVGSVAKQTCVMFAQTCHGNLDRETWFAPRYGIIPFRRPL